MAWGPNLYLLTTERSRSCRKIAMTLAEGFRGIYRKHLINYLASELQDVLHHHHIETLRTQKPKSRSGPPRMTTHRMARELLWLENSSFAAWGCSECNWIVPNRGRTVSHKAPAQVKEAFDQHKCAQYPRVLLRSKWPKLGFRV